MRYTKDLMTPQAWVGAYADPGHEPAVWFDHLSKVTKRWAEQLRFERGDNTAGFCLFSAECWFHHSYDPETATPYPVYSAVKQAFAPIGLALGTTQRRFWAGDTIAADVFVTNDDEQFRDFSNLSVQCELRTDGDASSAIGISEPVKLAKLAYYVTARVPISFPIPAEASSSGRRHVQLLIRLMNEDGHEISRTTDDLEIFAAPGEMPKPPADVIIPATASRWRGWPRDTNFTTKSRAARRRSYSLL